MERFIKLAILVALVYFGYSYGRPWIENLLDTEIVGAGGSDSERCLRQVERAASEVEERIERLGSPPYDAVFWERARGMVQGEVNRALGACTCDEPACTAGQNMIGELSAAVGDVGEAVSRGAKLTSIARRVETVKRRAEDARRDLESGF